MARLNTFRLKNDFPYYAQHLLQIKTKSKGLQPFVLNSIQNLLWYGKPKDYETNPIYSKTLLDEGIAWKIQNKRPVRNIILKYRQAGMSTFWAGIAFHDAVTHYGRTCLMIAHQDDTSANIFQMCKDFYRYLPPELRPMVNKNNAGELEFADPKGSTHGLNSRILTATAKNKGAGHGITAQTLCCSELSRWAYPQDTMTGINETIPTGLDAVGTTVVIESVANEAEDYFHNMWKDARVGRSPYSPIFLPWYLHNEYQLPLPSQWDIGDYDDELAEVKVDYPFLTNEQIFWYYTKFIEQETNHPGLGWKYMRMLYPGNESEAFTATGFCVFPEKALRHFSSRVRNPIKRGRVEINSKKILWDKDDGNVFVWEEPRPNFKYFIGADVSRGTGRSESAFQVIRYPGYVQVAEYGDNTIGPREYAHVLSAIGCYYNNAMIAVELENAGILTNTELASIYPSGNLYIWEALNQNKPAKSTGNTGWKTNTQEIKTLIVENANELLKQDPPRCVVNSAILLQQMTNFVIFSSGNISAVKGEDDRTISWLIALVVAWIKEGRHDMRGLLDSIPAESTYKDPSMYDTWNPEETASKDDWRYA